MRIKLTQRNGAMHETAAALSKTRSEIIKLRKAMVDKALELATKISELESQIAPADAREFLVARCNLSRSEIAFYGKVTRRLAPYTDVLRNNGVSYDMIRSLASARESVRGRALASIASGARFDLSDFRVLRKRIADDAMSAREISVSMRKRMMHAFAKRHAKTVIAEFETGATDLMHEIAGLNPSTVDGSPSSSAASIADKAQKLMPKFEAAFGSSHARHGDAEWRSLKPAAREVATTHRALGNLASAAEGSPRSQKIRSHMLSTLATGPLGTLARFTGNDHFMSGILPPPRQPLTKLPTKRLRTLELCAGAGGMAIGLEAAGFEHVALIEFDKNAAATMRRNRPNWPVVEKDLTTIDFTQYAGQIDLVCGGLPCQPYSEEGEGKGHADERDLLLEGARAVREIQPKAFLFENVRGALFAKHSDQIARFLKELNEAGYDVQIVEVNTQDYGIAQNRPRILFIGLRTRDRRHFEMPSRFPERRANVGETLYDLMSANGWSEAKNWAEYCRTATFELDDGAVVQGAQAFTLLGRKGKARKLEALRWKRSGLDPSGVPDAAPTDELARRNGPDFVPGLTIRMRAVLQNFPTEFEFVGGKESVAKQIGNAVAPRMAQAFGLALYSALEHVEFDIEAMLWPEDVRRKRPIIDPPPLEPSVALREEVEA
ncbi:DNA cytosine methyltransferase [Rhizobium sp. WW_1]|uniref:DNA cytosine methyltransferase n=3 Tax=Pseudomonadota TaxID=1224 RepID=UPI00102932AD|nr:DNA (cytosine-5-)-methyltransferase [Rhizobium sp. WW_1]